MDPTAWFTVVFEPDVFASLGRCGDCTRLNYTYFGSEILITNGFWLDVQVNFTDTVEQTDGTREYSAPLTVFVANSTGYNGLQGILGMAIASESDKNYSLVRQLAEKYSYPQEV